MQGRSGIRVGQRSRRLAVAGLCCAAFAWGAAPAGAAPGDLQYQGCLTGDPAIGPAGSNACALFPGVTTGDNTGFNALFAVAISPDGTSVYGVSQGDSAIVRFSRNPSTGVLTYQDCITGETASGSIGVGGSGACAEVAGHQATGNNSGFAQPYGIAISPDGASVYVTAVDDDSVLRFDRDTGSGALTYQGCFTGELATGDDGGNGSCAAIPSDTAGGDNSGFEKIRAIAVDPNGENVYVSGPADDSIARFTRAAGGALTYQGCFSAETATGPAGTNACTDLPGISAFGTNSGFDNPQAITVGPNGASLYVMSGNDASVTRFTRAAGTGVLTHAGCVTRDTSASAIACTQIAGGTADGVNSGLDNLRAAVIGPGGSSLYTVAGGDASIIHFSRDAGTGALTFQSCITGESAIGPGGTNKCATQIASATASGDDSGWGIAGVAPALAINAAGTGVYFGTGLDRSVVQMDRDTGTGALSFRRCFSSETETVSAPNAVCAAISPNASVGQLTALNVVNSLALSSDGSYIYTAAAFSDALARFSIEPAPAPPPAATPPEKKKKCKKKKKRKGKAGAAAKKCKKKKKGKK